MGKTKFFEGLKDWKTAESEQQPAGQPDPVSIPSGDDEQGQEVDGPGSQGVNAASRQGVNAPRSQGVKESMRQGAKESRSQGVKKDQRIKASIRIKPELYKRIKKHCIDRNTDFQGFMENLIDDYFKR